MVVIRTVAAAPEAINDQSAKIRIVDRSTETQAVVQTTQPDGTTAGNTPIVAGESQQDAEHISSASADKIESQSVPAVPVQPVVPEPETESQALLHNASRSPASDAAASEAATTKPHPAAPAPAQPENDPVSVPDAEVLSASVTPVTHPSDQSIPVLTSEQANALFPIENYGAYTADELHGANLENFKESERLHGKFTAHLYDRVLPGINESIKRLKNGDQINGFSGERQVGAYLESIGYTADLVRQWNKRYRDRMAALKKALGLTTGNDDDKLTPEQRELRDTLIQQGYSSPEATRLAKVAEGNSVSERFDWVMKQRASEISGSGTDTTTEEPAPEATETSTAAEPGGVTTVTDADAGELDEDSESREAASEPETEVTQEEETPVVQPTPAVTYGDWENFWETHPLSPASEYAHKYLAEAAASFIDRYRYAFGSSAFKKSLAMLKDNPDQVQANADDFARIAAVLRAAAENANLLAALIDSTANPEAFSVKPKEGL